MNWGEGFPKFYITERSWQASTVSVFRTSESLHLRSLDGITGRDIQLGTPDPIGNGKTLGFEFPLFPDASGWNEDVQHLRLPVLALAYMPSEEWATVGNELEATFHVAGFQSGWNGPTFSTSNILSGHE